MREILFKAKRTDNGEWIEGYCFTCGWDNAHIGKVSACSIPEMRYLLDESSENMTGWRAQIMKEFCKKM